MIKISKTKGVLCLVDKNLRPAGQVMIEFSFTMIIVMLMIFGVMMVFRWTGLDLAEKRIQHDKVLIRNFDNDYDDPLDGPLRQIDPFFYKPIRMNAVWKRK